LRGIGKWIGLASIILLLLSSCSGIQEPPQQTQRLTLSQSQPGQLAEMPTTLIHFNADELASPVWNPNTTGGATWEVDTSQYAEGGSSLKLTLPKGSSFQAQFRIYRLPDEPLWDLSQKYFTWWFKIECDSPVHFRENALALINHQHDPADSRWLEMRNYWAHSTDWIQFTASSGLGSQGWVPGEVDRISIKVQNFDLPDDGGDPGTSDCIVWIDGLDAYPGYPELPVATFSLDDGYLSWQKFGAILDEYGYKGCFNVTASGSFFDDEHKAVYQELVSGGHEIASHSLTRAVTGDNIWEELIKSRLMIQAEGLGPCRFFAQPGGSSKWTGDMFEKIGKVYAGYRLTEDCASGASFPQYVTNIGTKTDEEIREWIVNGVKQRNWLFLHGHAMEGDPYYSGSDAITEERLRFICELLDELGVPVKTYSEVATEERFPTPDLGKLLEAGEVVQGIGPCTPASNTSVHPAVSLTDEEQVITTGITSPDVYRCIRVMSNRPASAPARASFSGTGLNDMTSGGAYTGDAGSWQHYHGAYWIKVDSAGTTDTFRWTFDEGRKWSEPVAITGEAQLLSDGITVTFANTTGHTVGDTWAFGPVAEVRIVGENWDGLERMETIYLTDGTNPIDGGVPFKSISEIYLPAEPDGGSGHSISIGVCDKLGLYHLIATSADVTEQARKAADGSNYTTEPVGTVDAYYGTVDISPIADGDSFKFSYRAL
jgi:hypothetical protein